MIRGAFVGMLAALAVASTASAQGRGRNPPVTIEDNAPYDGQFTFARIRYTQALSGGFGFGGGRGPTWLHDYPRGERHFAKILSELGTIRARIGGSVILALDDPTIFKYPVIYMCEPGYWSPNDAEIKGLRSYLLKGGFMIFDDFRGRDWDNFEEQMRAVLPKARLIPVPESHPIYDSFYRINPKLVVPPYGNFPPEFYGIFENNDPNGRLMVMVNYNNDISEYWEWSDEGLFPIGPSNEAYKLGVNYVVYALTH
ncbi:MAG: DUF4159 domain-containing protein [Gemmatimonadota bacterium]